jgi:hypothetical protein
MKQEYVTLCAKARDNVSGIVLETVFRMKFSRFSYNAGCWLNPVNVAGSKRE